MKKSRVLLLMALIVLCISMIGSAAEVPAGKVDVVIGPTTIVNGAALSDRDITVTNEYFKISFAVGTAPPWGVPHGSIVDTAILVNGEWTDNRTALIDFLPNGWSAWPSTYQRVEVVENNPARAVIKVERDYAEGVDLVTTYTVEAGSKILKISTLMTNNGTKTYEGLISGYSLCTLSGYMFGPFGSEQPGYDQVAQSWYGDFVLGYDEAWTMALHYPGFTDFAYGTGWKDLYYNHNIAPGEVKVFDAWVQFADVGSASEILEFNVGIKNETVGTLKGQVVTTGGSKIDKPIIIVEKVAENGKEMLYVWDVGSDGAYSFKLPPGKYLVHAVAKGYSISAKRDVTIEQDKISEITFDDLQKGGTVILEIKGKNTGEPLDARVEITEGPEILVGYVGAKTFFTKLDNIGQAEFLLAPGDYVLTLSKGAGFISKEDKVSLTVEPEGIHTLSQALEVLIDLPREGWYSADLHHHSDILDGVTPPDYLVRSQLASGLDIIFVSDHDSIANNKKIKELASGRGIPFISSIEVSPNWGHINMLPIPLDKPVNINPAGTVSEIFAEGRKLNALIIIAHPYISYGYFYNLEKDMVPGGFDPDFDLIEINAAIRARDNYRALQKAWDFWSEGKKYYLTGGSDVHDVWLYRSGNARTIAHVTGQFSLEKYYQALKQGNSYATYGPLVYPDQMFGEMSIFKIN
ncbi:MAG: CehA/McbA family metallohydrolase [Bacillota bacterium]